MEWVLFPIIGALIGAMFSIISRSIGVPFWTNVAVGALGALLGAAVDDVAKLEPVFGKFTDLIVAGTLILGSLIGMMLAYTLIGRNERNQKTS